MSAQHANGKVVPFDLEAAAAAAAAEAEEQPFAFTYKGAQYTVPPQTSWPMSATRALGRGELDAALPQLLGNEAFEKLCDAGLTLGELAALFGAMGEVAGMGGLPNSSAPVARALTRT